MEDSRKIDHEMVRISKIIFMKPSMLTVSQNNRYSFGPDSRWIRINRLIQALSYTWFSGGSLPGTHFFININ